VTPLAHEEVQTPEVQVCPDAQERPQAPQLEGSTDRFAQDPAHDVEPPVQAPRVQTPTLQTKPAPQALPHDPQ